MLRPNNPDIDFDQLNARIAVTLESYQKTKPELLPSFDPKPKVSEKSLNWAELTGLEDEELLKAAYQYLLGRPIDKAGRDHYLSRLRSGEDKFEILATLHGSSEGKAHNASAPGLKRARLKLRLRKLPIIGKGMLWVMGLLASESRLRVNNARFNYLIRVAHQQASTAGQQSQRLAEQQRQLARQEYRLDGLSQSLNGLSQNLLDIQSLQEQRINALEQYLEHTFNVFGQRLEQASHINQELRARLVQLEVARAAVSPVTTAANDQDRNKSLSIAKSSNLPESTVPDSFYLAFENRFRGSPEVIADRLRYYLPIIDRLTPLREGYPLIDIGCGRGEWLKLLPEHVLRIGVDLNASNVEACHEQGFTAYHMDALVWLAQQPDSSIGVISAFHVIEHLSFEQLNQLLDLCMRVLTPGGMILFETPNPENIISAATHFYTDPTHLHPLPPAFTEFLCQFKGFDNIEIHRLTPVSPEYQIQESSEVAQRCNALFYGPQDYSITGYKPGMTEK
ncbi:methyltransferase domain-containing protein [Pseudomonas luteola]|uniref:Methyltransferase domain-containing protein n=1 Tax=Pseudomonas luteola TaxID=47886 RepID=A0ABS0MMR3_PSELU|nr:methyltransferase domain-containing protein [Pseudomonas luteola]MBH3438016.1 methyltransferase domain-containing protein [Pseudomonas luteola]